jgi:hypothetical protein
MATSEGHIDLEPLRVRITSTLPNNIAGYASLGIGSSLEQEGAVGPELVLFGNKGQGFAQLDTADGPARLHLEPGMWNGKVLPGGNIDLTSKGPLIQVSDQRGFTATVGHSQLEAKSTGKRLNTSAASVVLSVKDKVLWFAP